MSKHDPSAPAYAEIVEEITKLYSSLPPRPTLEDLEAAASVISTANTEEQRQLQELSKPTTAPQGVPEELFSILVQVERGFVLFQSSQLKREALRVIDLEKAYETFDGLIRRASELVSGSTRVDVRVDPDGQAGRIVAGDESDSVADKTFRGIQGSSVAGFVNLGRTPAKSSNSLTSSGEGDGKFSLMKSAAFIENFAKTGGNFLDLRGKLMDQVEWLPHSIGKLSNVTELNLSENCLLALPPTIGSLVALTKIDLHSNQLMNLPDSFGELLNLMDLDLHSNQLKSLPASFKNLTNLAVLNLSSNRFTHLPETVGNLTNLKTLNVETNNLEEVPYTIGACSSLVELRLDFNHLKALPEAIGKLECMQILTLHYNRIKRLPTTMGNLSNLRELDVSFNELESVPENLCFALHLEKLNVGKNFADLTALPRSIGNLEMLEELDISDNQITFLPDSFRFLSKLRVLRADETPLIIPPKQVVKLGAQAAVQYMADLATKNEVISPSSNSKKKGFWSWICLVFCSARRSTT